MQIATVSGVAITIGWVLALLVLLMATLGLVGVLPASPVVLFALIGALAVARLA